MQGWCQQNPKRSPGLSESSEPFDKRRANAIAMKCKKEKMHVRTCFNDNMKFLQHRKHHTAHKKLLTAMFFFSPKSCWHDPTPRARTVPTAKDAVIMRLNGTAQSTYTLGNSTAPKASKMAASPPCFDIVRLSLRICSSINCFASWMPAAVRASHCPCVVVSSVTLSVKVSQHFSHIAVFLYSALPASVQKTVVDLGKQRRRLPQGASAGPPRRSHCTAL